MTKPNFTLLTGIKGPMQELPDPELVRIPLRGHSTKTIKKKAPVNVGTLVAKHPDPQVGDAHSSIAGVVVDGTETEVVIDNARAKPAKEGDGLLPRPPRWSPWTWPAWPRATCARPSSPWACPPGSTPAPPP